MRTVSILLAEVPAGYKAVRAGTGTDGTYKLVASDTDPPVLRSEQDEHERKFRLLLRAFVLTGFPIPSGLESDFERAMQE